MRRTKDAVTGVFCTGGSEREFTLEERWYVDETMKRYKPEQIITLLRQIVVEIANGKTTPQAGPRQLTARMPTGVRKEQG